MSIRVAWDQSEHVPEKTVIYWTFDGSWDWNDFSDADKLAYDMAISTAETVHSIIDFRASPKIPSTGAIGYFKRSITKAPPNRGKIVIVGASLMIRALEGILRSLAPKDSYKYRMADNLDDAYRILEGGQDQ
jgi:hypothetical protein